jgi:hypothetical protein
LGLIAGGLLSSSKGALAWFFGEELSGLCVGSWDFDFGRRGRRLVQLVKLKILKVRVVPR